MKAKNTKRISSVLVIISLIAALLLGCQSSGKEQDSITSEEIIVAIDVGLVPEKLQNNYNKQISFEEFTSLVDNFYSIMYPEQLNQWKELSEHYRTSDQLMSRMDGMLVFLYAAQCAQIDAIGYEYNIPVEDHFIQMNPEKDFWEGMTYNQELLPDAYELYYNDILANSEHYSWRCEYPYINNAVWFAQCFSYGNGSTYFDYDDNYSFGFGNDFTRKEAIIAVERLYETARYAIYIPLEDVSCQVSENAIEKGNTLPAASYNNLPDWKGHTIINCVEKIVSGGSIHFEEEEVLAIAEYGFNFVRVPLDFSLLFDGTNTNVVCTAYLESMDKLVNWCAESGIHICFDLHDMPGFTTNSDDSDDILFEDATTQKLFIKFWEVLAEHYKDVPSNLLSFNLLNEPHAREDELSEAKYASVMLPAIDKVLEISPDRLIFIDMLGVTDGKPVEYLSKAKVAQAFHPYFISGNMTWPANGINGFIHKDNGELILNGSFKEGAKLSFSIDMAHATSSLNVAADGVPVASFEIGGETVGENGCIGIHEQGTGGECRSYENKVYNIVLNEPCAQLRIMQNGDGCWYSIGDVSIEDEKGTVRISSSEFVASEVVPELTIDIDGIVTAKCKETLVVLNRDALKDTFSNYTEFSQRTGQAIMVQEYGCELSVNNEVALNAMDDLLSVLTELDIPWCSWHSTFGVLINEDTEKIEAARGNSMMRDGANYEYNEKGFYVCTDMLDVVQKYM